MVCRGCGFVSNHLLLNAFDPTQFESASGSSRGGRGKGVYVREIVNRNVKRDEEIRGYARKAFVKAGRMYEPPVDLVRVLRAISDARDYTPEESAETVPLNTVLEGKGGVFFRAVRGPDRGSNAPKRVWKPTQKTPVPHRLGGLNVAELIGVIMYALGGSMEETARFVRAVAKKKVDDGYGLIERTARKPGVDRVLQPLLKARPQRVANHIYTFFPNASRWTPEKIAWIRRRTRALLETERVPDDLAFRGSAYVYESLHRSNARAVPTPFRSDGEKRAFYEAYRTTSFASDVRNSPA